MSLDTFRNKILSNSGEGRVQVNQRDLIDKILARYSCKFVIYRELMQNSDDAESSSVKIIFETNGNKITRILFKNNGFAFRPEDWDRLVKIAEGNPDEQKIGAFGVGFYSLFAVTENPFVSSGGQGMAFFWRGNQIFTKQGPMDDDDDKGWTTFLMDTREPLEIPNIEELTKFLVNSLGFTDNLKEISMYIDNILITKVSKKMQDPESINITSVNIKHLRSDVYKTEEASVIFRIAKGSLNIKISKEFSAKMERITKKNPPNNTSIQMIFTEFDERNTSKDYYKNISPIFKDLISYPEQGKIYIAARVIPTMERELVDFAEETLAEYNNEMLCLAGTLSRILYEYEMTRISNFYNEIISSDIENNEETKRPEKHASEPKMKKSLYKWLIKRFKFNNRTPIVQSISPYRKLLEKWSTHAIAHFTYNTSTPNVQVYKMAETQFFDCLKKNMHILSTNGVHPITNVRLPNPEMAGFIKTVPLIPKNLLEQCEPFFNKAKGTKLIVELGFEDVLVELKSRALSEEEIIKLLKWWISYLSKGNKHDMRLLNFTRISDNPQTLNRIKFYLNPDKIPLDIDIPFEVIPYIISKHFNHQELTNGLKWTELPLVYWAKFIVEKPELETDPKFAEKVLHILAKNIDNVYLLNDKEAIRKLFIKKRCIPTKFGMKLPNESYFRNDYIFPNLPTIKFHNFTSSIRLLMEYFGVRKVVELKLILKQLVNQEDCDFVRVVKYLASIYDELKDDEKNILKNEPIWPKENLLGSQTTKKIQRFVARDLYVPIRSLHELGLTIINWNAEWSNSSKEELALKYFIDNFDKYSVNYKPEEINIAFLPCSKSNTYAKPSECFINDRCRVMNFKTIREDLRSKAEIFGIRQYPYHEELVKKLTENPPQDGYVAMKVFEYLYSRQHDFTDSDWNILNNSEFVPIKNENESNGSTYKHIKPRDCFFKLKEENLNDFFLCVDFGTKANEFLAKCGVKKITSNDFDNLEIHPSHNKLWNLYLKNYFHILEKINPDLETIFKRAAPPTYPQIRELFLKYFIDNFKKYSECYNPETVDIAFLPCSNSNGYARPSDCFINDECTIMNLQTIRKDLRSKAEKLGVRQIPDYKKLKEKLIENPPQNKNEAKKVFEYLNRFNYNWSSLINIQFIPIQDESKLNNKYFKPSDCFFKLKEESLNEFFLCVDFGTKANEFLAKCGVREPTLYDFAKISVDPSHELWKLYLDNYLKILTKINPNLETILNLAANPIYPKIREMLTENPPKNLNVAKEVFDYLYTQQESFTDSDWKKLEDFEFIPIQPNKLFKPRDCFLKIKEESLNNFFPCVDFGTKANEFLAKCGVKKPSSYDFSKISVDPSHKLWNLYLENYLKILTKINPNLETILNLAAKSNYPEIRELAFKYFVDNFYSKYSKFYKPEEIDVAFLPCSNSNSYAKHSECFINDECKIMGFKIIREDLSSKAGDFGVRQNPNREKLIKMLIENPPKNKNKAKEVFEYLNTQQESFTDSDWKKLKDNEFIPINYESQSNKNINELDDLFKPHIYRLLFKSSHELWNLCKNDTKKYLHILEKITDINNKFPEKNLNKDDVLIAIKTDSKGNDCYFLATVKEIYINDDKVNHKIFNPFTPPENLRDFYKKLGCKSLHESVTKSVVPHDPIQKTKYSRQLQRIIRERASLLYLNNSEEHIRKDEKWLQKLKVREIEYMETSYKLGSITKNERNDITTNISQKNTISWILYVTPNSNLIDISQQLVNHIFTSHYQNTSYFNTILTAPLSNLKDMGIIHPKLQNDQQSTSNTFPSQHNDVDISSENTRNLRNFLQVAIKSYYSNSESNINSIKTCIYESKVNYCETMPGYSMHCVGNLQKIELYVPTDVDQSEILSQSRIVPLSKFIYILKDLANVFEVTPKVIHIFYDNSKNSIAFNRDGALFFNLKFYLELHEQTCKNKPTIDAMTYWFTIYCHVLAHNFIQLHNPEFEYYYSSFAQAYMPDFIELTKKREIKSKTFNIEIFWKNFNRILNRN
ncbi:hypothetical protein RhiirA4_454398 [Rhizophagus irregularis]|uniref:Sacsin/Nov domain-containing protein n=1 Tax=Rhizophagus irregularis TaxID=588596 RepID=A0A2I1G2V1_9GLOM|nr:hypothetical protein RhiirA4_454398 [Rhizophagus irregularis]